LYCAGKLVGFGGPVFEGFLLFLLFRQTKILDDLALERGLFGYGAIIAWSIVCTELICYWANGHFFF